MQTNLSVNSEIGRLRQVICHPPGPELLAVTPMTRQEYLYDDIIDLEGAIEEHRRFTSILSRFANVLDVRTMLEETLENEEARNFLIDRSIEITAFRSLSALKNVAPAELARSYIEGSAIPSGPFSRKLERENYALPPLPNLFFTRDASMVIANQAVVSAMRFSSRWPEEALMRTIYGYHPSFAGSEIVYDGSDERRKGFTLEGGDIHVLSEDTVFVGLSERTSAAALDELCELLFSKTTITEVLTVVLPDRTTAIHLDMVWSQIDRDICVAYGPLFHGASRAPVLHRRKGQDSVQEASDLFSALANVGLKMEPVYCGGDIPPQREREQWASGCNFFSVAPGQALSYRRNHGTLEALEKAGFRLVDAEGFLLGDEQVNEGDKVIITFAGPELVRGGGGPRCMTCPVKRDDL